MKNSILDELVSISGSNATDDIRVRDKYAHDQSFAPPRRPNYVVMPQTTEQVQQVIRAANKYNMPIIPYSSGTDFHGGTVPNQGGILVNLKKMNRIMHIDPRNWSATIEPGVTYRQLQAELRRRKLRVAVPFTSPPSASIIADYMDRKPVITAADMIFGNELFNTFSIILPSGELFTVGHPPTSVARSTAPDGPALDFYRLFQGAQGTMGIVVSMSIRILPLPAAQQVCFIPRQTMAEVVNTIQCIQRRELGLECFALNSFDLASLVLIESRNRTRLLNGKYVGINGARPWEEAHRTVFHRNRKLLPEWAVIVVLTGWGRRADEKVDYQKLDLIDLAAEQGFKLLPNIGSIPALDKITKADVILPWRMQNRFGYRGSCHSLCFHVRPDRLAGIQAELYRMTAEYNYPGTDVGAYVQPIERGRSMYCELDLHSNPGDVQETERVKILFDAASKSLVNKGAFFDRPYGPWADIMYGLAGTYTEYSRKIKHRIDPNNIMNPGRLCF